MSYLEQDKQDKIHMNKAIYIFIYLLFIWKYLYLSIYIHIIYIYIYYITYIYYCNEKSDLSQKSFFFFVMSSKKLQYNVNFPWHDLKLKW